MSNSITMHSAMKLRMDTYANFWAVGTHVPEKGEVCIVETTSSGLRMKVGNGSTSFNDLPFSDSMVIQGYYDATSDKFYTSSEPSTETEIDQKDTNILYIDKSTNVIYFYYNGHFLANTAQVPGATETTPGIVKLYKTLGANEDGAMTQKSIKETLQQIQFVAENETLSLNVPTV